MDEFIARLERLEAERDIERLCAVYGFALDEHDVDALRLVFHADAVLRSEDGVFDATGIDAIVDTYRRRLAVVGASHHTTQDRLLSFSDENSRVARGLVSARVDAVRDGVPMAVSLRYKDLYRLDQRGWRIAERVLSYMYFMPVRDLPVHMGDADANRAYSRPAPSDWPESLRHPDRAPLLRNYGVLPSAP